MKPPKKRRFDGTTATQTPHLYRKALSRRRNKIAKVSRKAHR